MQMRPENALTEPPRYQSDSPLALGAIIILGGSFSS